MASREILISSIRIPQYELWCLEAVINDNECIIILCNSFSHMRWEIAKWSGQTWYFSGPELTQGRINGVFLAGLVMKIIARNENIPEKTIFSSVEDIFWNDYFDGIPNAMVAAHVIMA